MVDIDPACLSRASEFTARSASVAFRGFHFWASVAPGDIGVEGWVDPVEGGQLWKQCPMPPGMWQITTTAAEYRRSAGEATLLPLPDDAYQQVPAGVDPFTRRSSIQLEVSANDGVDFRLFQMDCNQSVVVVAQDICINWWGPPSTRDVQGKYAPSERPPLTGFVIDSFVGISLSRVESAGVNNAVTLTKHLYVPAGTRGSIPIPAYAQEVTIYQEPTLGIASVAWTQTLGDPNGVSGFLPMAALPFIPGQRRSQISTILPNVSHLWSDIDPDTPRFFTLVWTVRP